MNLTDEVTYRVWLVSMAGSAESFASGRISLAQVMLAKPTVAGDAGLPLTRADAERQE